jgi:hypothetical protein
MSKNFINGNFAIDNINVAGTSDPIGTTWLAGTRVTDTTTGNIYIVITSTTPGDTLTTLIAGGKVLAVPTSADITSAVAAEAILRTAADAAEVIARDAAIAAESNTPDTPVNAVASVGTLTLTGVVIDGEILTVDTDVFEFDDDGVVSGSNIAIDISAYTVKSQGTLTMDTLPTLNDTTTIDTTTYIWVGTSPSVGEVDMGASLTESKANLLAAINGTDGINPGISTVTIGAWVVNDLVITAALAGTIGDAIATTSSFTAGTNQFDAVTLGTTTAGVDCPAADADGEIVTRVSGQSTTVTATQGGGTTVTMTADVAGVAGNSIVSTTTMANATFGAGTLGDGVAGVDGTVGTAGVFVYDATNLYMPIADNTIADANWKKLVLQSL